MTVSQAAAPVAAPAGTRTARGERWLRAATHLAAWLPFGYGLTRTWRPGWRPISDNAAIALRSWDAISPHPLEVGQPTRLAGGIYDPGPLQYLLQAIPVHIDPLHGVIWGAALWCMLACSLTIEAARAVSGRAGGLLAAGVTLGAVAWLPRAAVVPCWNPWFGLMSYLAALSAGYAVLCGRRRWWPVAVAAASVAAQAHLMFVVGSVLLGLVTLVAGMIGATRAGNGYRWLAAGLATGLLCWIFPLAQEFTARTGNLTALIRAELQVGPTTGLGYGLRAVAAATRLPPLWWTPMVKPVGLRMVDDHQAWLGLLALTVSAGALAAAAHRRRAPRLAALAGLALLTGLTAVATLAGLPLSILDLRPSPFEDLGYVLSPLYPAGVLSWLVAGGAVALAWRLMARRNQARVGPGGPPPWASAVALAAVIAAPGAVSVASVSRLGGIHSPVMDEIGAASRQIKQQDLGGRRLVLQVVCANSHITRQLTLGLVYALRTQGYGVQVSRGWALQLGRAYRWRHSARPWVTVHLVHRRMRARVTPPPAVMATALAQRFPPQVCRGRLPVAAYPRPLAWQGMDGPLVPACRAA